MHKVFVLVFVMFLLFITACSPSSDRITIEGEWRMSKGCMAEVDGYLLNQYANRCDESRALEGTVVRVTGTPFSIDSCPPTEQCAIGNYLIDTTEPQILSVVNTTLFCCGHCVFFDEPDCSAAFELPTCDEFFKTHSPDVCLS